MGLHRQREGRVALDGEDVSGSARRTGARVGLGWVPDDRGIYASLTVEENLVLPPVVPRRAPGPLDQVYASFPVLQERRDFPGTKLSGGEQQMLAIARVLRMGARLLLLDEPSEGLAPVIVQRIGEIIRDITKQHGVAVLLVEQNVHLRLDRRRPPLPARAGPGRRVARQRRVRPRQSELLDYLGM